MRFLLIIASAFLTGLCFAFYKAGFLAIFTVIPLFYVILSEAEKQKKPFRFYGYGYIWGVVFYACIFYWFAYQYPLEYNGFSKGEAVAYVALTWFGIGVLLSVILALWPFFTGMFVRTKLCRKYPWLFIPFTSCLYIITEYIFTLGSLASPWARLAITQQSNILGIQTASLFGSYFISFIVVSVNAALAYCLFEFLKHKNKKIALICLVSAVSLYITNIGLGGILYAVDRHRTDSLPHYTASALQGNVVSGRSGETSVASTVERFLQMSKDNINETGAKLIVMPEGCFQNEVAYDSVTKNKLLRFSEEYDAVIIFGCFEHDENGDFYNVTYCVSPDGTFSGPYKKQHPVPFGEFTPAKNVILTLMPFLKDVTDIGDELAAGKESTVFDSSIGKIGSFICFDSAFEKIGYEETSRGAVVLTESTNDSWWMDSAQLYEHNGHAVLRAVESRRYVVRASSAGYSTIIDPTGRILSGVDALTAGFATADIANRDDISFYHKTPYLFPILCALTVTGGFVWAFVRKKRDIKKNNEIKDLQN